MGMGAAALAAMVVLAQAAAQAPAAATDAPAAAASAKPEKPKKICVEEEQMGSHFKRRICATEAEWEKRRERDAAEQSRARANTR